MAKSEYHGHDLLIERPEHKVHIVKVDDDGGAAARAPCGRAPARGWQTIIHERLVPPTSICKNCQRVLRAQYREASKRA